MPSHQTSTVRKAPIKTPDFDPYGSMMEMIRIRRVLFPDVNNINITSFHIDTNLVKLPLRERSKPRTRLISVEDMTVIMAVYREKK